MTSSGLLVAAVYCGGCNPEIDREGLIANLGKEMGQPVHSLKEAGGRTDIVLLVNGCTRRCLLSGTSREWPGKPVVVAGLTIDGWPVSREEMVYELSRKVKEIAQVARRL